MKYLLFAVILFSPVAVLAQQTPAPDTTTVSDTQNLAERVTALESQLAGIQGAPAKSSIGAFNPAVGMAMDFAFHDYDPKSNVDFRSAELNLEAPVDPFVKAWAVITGSNAGIDVEEAAGRTTQLPYNLTVTGGRLFASFGRLPHFHDHELPVVDRPNSINTYVGGESQGDGAEVNWLAPTDVYINVTLGAYNKMGTDNNRVSNETPRGLDGFTYLARLDHYEDLTDDMNLELGLDSAWTPNGPATDDAGDLLPLPGDNNWRTLNGADLTVRYQPTNGGLYHGLLWGTEAVQNDEQRISGFVAGPPSSGFTRRRSTYAGYSFVEMKMGPTLRPGVMVDLTEDPDYARHLTRTYSAYLSYNPDEFDRLRLEYSRVSDNTPGVRDANVVALQWTIVIGWHVHGFRDR